MMLLFIYTVHIGVYIFFAGNLVGSTIFEGLYWFDVKLHAYIYQFLYCFLKCRFASEKYNNIAGKGKGSIGGNFG